MTFTGTFAAVLLDFLFEGTPYNRPTNYYAALFNGNTEQTGNGYSRQPISIGNIATSGQLLGAEAIYYRMTADLSYGTPTAQWIVDRIMLMEGPSGGDRRFAVHKFAAATAETGQPVKSAAGKLTFGFNYLAQGSSVGVGLVNNTVYLATALMNHCYGSVPYVPPSAFYVGLAKNGNEISGGGYVRKAFTYAATQQVVTLGGMNAAAKVNNADIDWPTPTAPWDINQIIIYDNATPGSGNALFFQGLPEDSVIQAGGSLSIKAGKLQVGFTFVNELT